VRPAQEHVELPSKEQVDPNEQDRRHARERTTGPGLLKTLC
jgi:hypothetical protein